MKVQGINYSNQNYFKAIGFKNKSELNTSKNETAKENSYKKQSYINLFIALGALLLAAVEQKKISNIVNNFNLTPKKQLPLNSLEDIVFENGIAKKGNELFSGVISDTLKNGKQIRLKYKDGKIQESLVEGVKKTFITRKDSQGRTFTIIKKINPDGSGKLYKKRIQGQGLVIKEFEINPKNNTKMQTKYFEKYPKGYLRADTRTIEERQNPQIIFGEFNPKREQIASKSITSSEANKPAYIYDSVDDEGFGKYILKFNKKTIL